jgi:multiple sugar transport system permease protein
MRRSDIVTAWLFCSPALLVLVTVIVVPFVFAIGISLTNMRLVSNPGVPRQFVGLQNYIRILSDPVFYTALKNNIVFTGSVIVLQGGLALGLALLVNTKLPGVHIFRVIYFMPVVMAMIVVAIIWSFFFNPQEGLINEFLRFITAGEIDPPRWLASPQWALFAIVVLSSWQGAGFFMVIFLAGLKNIPSELYESARIDGAGAFAQFRYITIPQLRPAIIFTVISITVLAFKLFTQVWALTRGGPSNATLTLVVLMYRTGFTELKLGYSSALAVLFFMIIFAISLIQSRLLMRGGDA